MKNTQIPQKEHPSLDTSVIEEFVVDNNVIMFMHEDDDEPETHQDIFKSPNSKEWLDAIEYELNALKRNQTWTLVDRPKNKNIISSLYIFRIKRDKYGKIDRYRARLVARGFSQRQGQDFTETDRDVCSCSKNAQFSSVAYSCCPIRSFDRTM